ncbi:MAG: hypothetical protein AB7F64_00055 [Gammaproteobacteria bacterium]
MLTIYAPYSGELIVGLITLLEVAIVPVIHLYLKNKKRKQPYRKSLQIEYTIGFSRNRA